MFLSLLLTLNTSGEVQDVLRKAHGIFKGEIRPVLYVSDVEKRAPIYRDVLGFDFHRSANSDDHPYYAEMVVDG